MKEGETIPYENLELLKEISRLTKVKSELYFQIGPGSNDYVDVTLQLNVLVTRYVEEKIEKLLIS